MFNKKIKPVVCFLAMIIGVLNILFVSAVKNAESVYIEVATEENTLIDLIKQSANESFRRKAEGVLAEIETGRASWLECCHNGHPELYYLWLAGKYTEMFRVVGENGGLKEKTRSFIDNLLESVRKTHKKVYAHYVFCGLSASQLKGYLQSASGRYIFDAL